MNWPSPRRLRFPGDTTSTLGLWRSVAFVAVGLCCGQALRFMPVCLAPAGSEARSLASACVRLCFVVLFGRAYFFGHMLLSARGSWTVAKLNSCRGPLLCGYIGFLRASK